MMILEWVLKKKDARLWPGFIRMRIGSSDGLFVNMVANLQVPEKWADFLTRRTLVRGVS
jgi:hypothetical protein